MSEVSTENVAAATPPAFNAADFIPGKSQRPTETITSAVVRFGGDSGDGMQLVGDIFTNTCAVNGDSFATLPDFPSEIRAPVGTVFGVSGFQLCFSQQPVYTPGDQYDVLVAMNPAALRVNIATVRSGGVVFVNEDTFQARNLEKAGYTTNPLDGAELSKYKIVKVPMTTNVTAALQDLGMTPREADRCKNFYALGLLFWLFNRDFTYAHTWLQRKFRNKPLVLQANIRALKAGWDFAEKSTALSASWLTRPAEKKTAAGLYRNITGNQATAMGLMAAAQKANLKLYLGSYPITPATDIMHELAKYPDFATIFQAEDEIAGIGAAIGASFAGALAVTTTSGPGFSLKSEFMNLAVMAELPLVIVDVQRAGPSTGMPTKTEQSDLMQAIWGRHGESPLVVMAASSPSDCFDAAFEAAKIALKYMVPVILLTEGYLGNGSEVWKVPQLSDLPSLLTRKVSSPEGYKPYARDPQTLARPWAIPGTPGLEHRLGGLEKEDITGSVSQVPANHEKMCALRAEKVARVTQDIPATEVFGHANAEVLVLGWAGSYGAIHAAVENLSRQGVPVAAAHLRFLNPLPSDLPALLKKYKKVLVPELNSGHLWRLLRSELLIDTVKLSKIKGQPFRIDEIEAKVLELVKSLEGVKA